ncbi:MAG: hypothetical protein HZC48_06535 [Nitrospirae bacterium]|nr:hypothetical protein [Nitrospirota bacterium]
MNNKIGRIHITKLNASLRQLETAVILWFNDADAISVHTLASAAYQILYDLNKHQNGPPLLPDLPASNIIRPESRKEVKRAMREWANFMKHADKDPSAIASFNPNTNEFLLLYAIETYSTLTRDIRPILQCFRAWFAIIHPDLFSGQGFQEFNERITKVFQINQRSQINKIKFFNETLSIFTSGLISTTTE